MTDTSKGSYNRIRSKQNSLYFLVVYADGEKRYIIAPVGLKVGDVIVSGPDADIKVGNTLPLKNIPVGKQLYTMLN